MRTTRTQNTQHTPRLAKLKAWAEEQGLPYTSARDAGIRGEFPILRFGRALYIERQDGERWIETRKLA